MCYSLPDSTSDITEAQSLGWAPVAGWWGYLWIQHWNCREKARRRSGADRFTLSAGVRVKCVLGKHPTFSLFCYNTCVLWVILTEISSDVLDERWERCPWNVEGGTGSCVMLPAGQELRAQRRNTACCSKQSGEAGGSDTQLSLASCHLSWATVSVSGVLPARWSLILGISSLSPWLHYSFSYIAFYQAFPSFFLFKSKSFIFCRFFFLMY